MADGQAPADGPVKGELRESRGQPVSEHGGEKVSTQLPHEHPSDVKIISR